MLLKTRSMLLKGEGYRVVSATGFEQAVTKCKIGAFDLLILGHTVPAEDKRALVKIFREHCPAPVLVLRRLGQAAIADAEYQSLSDSPQRLLDLVKQILSGPGKTP
jgi:DNA-binding response OmpR family regulator